MRLSSIQATMGLVLAVSSLACGGSIVQRSLPETIPHQENAKVGAQNASEVFDKVVRTLRHIHEFALTNPDPPPHITYVERRMRKVSSIVSEVESSDELGLLAKFCWMLKDLGPTEGYYDACVEAFFCCLNRLAEQTDEQASSELSSIMLYTRHEEGFRNVIEEAVEYQKRLVQEKKAK